MQIASEECQQRLYSVYASHPHTHIQTKAYFIDILTLLTSLGDVLGSWLSQEPQVFFCEHHLPRTLLLDKNSSWDTDHGFLVYGHASNLHNHGCLYMTSIL